MRAWPVRCALSSDVCRPIEAKVTERAEKLVSNGFPGEIALKQCAYRPVRAPNRSDNSAADSIIDPVADPLLASQGIARTRSRERYEALEGRIGAYVLNISSDVEKMLLYWRLNWGHR